MISLLRLVFCFLAFFMIAANPHNFANEGAATLGVSEPVALELIAETESMKPGEPFWVAIHMSLDKQWHIYWKNPGDAGMAPQLTWNLPPGFEAGPLQWPAPQRFTLGSAVGFGYEGEVVFLAQITPPSFLKETSPIKISADVRWVVCSDTTCLPGEGHSALELPIKSENPTTATRWTKTFHEARSLIPKKNQSITAERNNKSIELKFNGTLLEEASLQSIDFFPENKLVVDYKIAAALDRSSTLPRQQIIVLKAVGGSEEVILKGVLSLHTSHAVEFYEIDTPVKPLQIEDEIISMGGSSYAVGNRALRISKSEAPAANEIPASLENAFAFKGGFMLALFFAFIGGMLLNLMPCVLPVISLKVLSFVKLAGESRKLIFQHGLAFSFGVLLSFWVLASILLTLQTYGRSVGWGFQLQEPLFVAGLAAALLIFALSLFGLFEIGTSMISIAGHVQPSSTKGGKLFGSFFSGVLATAVATPCTGPFLGSAVGFAVTLSAPLALLIFTFLGLGMSLPYLILAAFPSLLRFMPKAGSWMGTFKELMGFFMLATVLWLVWVFGALTNAMAISILLAGFLLMALACWTYGRWATPLNRKLTRTISMCVAAALLLFGGYAVVLSSSSWVEAIGERRISSSYTEAEIADAWEEFSPQRVIELRKQGIPVFIDFTAKWCLICQANHLVLSTDEVTKKFSERGVVKMKADWTKNDEQIAAELRKFGRNSVPLYVLYDADVAAQPKVLPQVLTPDTVIEALEKL